MWCIWPFATSIPPLVVFAVVNGFCGSFLLVEILGDRLTDFVFFFVIAAGGMFSLIPGVVSSLFGCVPFHGRLDYLNDKRLIFYRFGTLEQLEPTHARLHPPLDILVPGLLPRLSYSWVPTSSIWRTRRRYHRIQASNLLRRCTFDSRLFPRFGTETSRGEEEQEGDEGGTVDADCTRHALDWRSENEYLLLYDISILYTMFFGLGFLRKRDTCSYTAPLSRTEREIQEMVCDDANRVGNERFLRLSLLPSHLHSDICHAP